MKKTINLLAGITAFILIASCNSNSDKTTTTETTKDTMTNMVADTTTTATPAAAELTDPQIASIAVTANQIDVDYGEIAKKKSTNAEIKKFAETMINDHKKIIKQATDLAAKLNVTPESNPTTQSLLDGATTMKGTLDNSTGKDFDKAYAQNEAAYHEAVLETVKNKLIPASKNEELKNLLQSAVPLLEHHLQMAKDLASKFQ